jgi:hypothetical protein
MLGLLSANANERERQRSNEETDIFHRCMTRDSTWLKSPFVRGFRSAAEYTEVSWET